MLKAKLIRRIIESCREQDPRGTEIRARPGTRSPAAGGGLTDLASPVASSRRPILRDPRLGQTLHTRRDRRRRPNRG